eukprot:1467861-Pyramimonas_sp.AAC.1
MYPLSLGAIGRRGAAAGAVGRAGQAGPHAHHQGASAGGGAAAAHQVLPQPVHRAGHHPNQGGVMAGVRDGKRTDSTLALRCTLVRSFVYSSCALLCTLVYASALP